ncbi:sigma-70 family RNA polymerase sigma factor [Flavivirga jejuensis]|uniref:Sigma-70 family RNA polymerase sigma factor n=1 Tax=Flavivirga jejuensis TaxID=870487 RepID=A0ABT8WTZ1_9FLAO|nr:sigma-70 family RNA polymerase sigma factor [Flavivirga jejuensis]MDO5976332.1 sigma-70 family RNA polymerase sigma factor [Flavivirga jejuensis]
MAKIAPLKLFRKKSNTNLLQITDFKTPKKFEKVYNTYWEKVYAVSYNNTKKVELAQGMTQEIFKSLWERRENLQIKNIENYLVRATKLKVAEYYRNKVIRENNLNKACENYCDAANCTENDVSFSLLVEELGLLVDKLPCQCQNVFKMSREQGISNKQIASQLQITERAVEYHISKALKFLKTNLSTQLV